MWVSAAKQLQPRQLWDDCFFYLKDSHTWSKQRQHERMIHQIDVELLLNKKKLNKFLVFINISDSIFN
jgi:hypothetical protein